jgi:hypothetical protein
VALFTLPNDVLDKLHPYLFRKTQMAKLPKSMWPKPKSYGLVLVINEQGDIKQSHIEINSIWLWSCVVIALLLARGI